MPTFIDRACQEAGVDRETFDRALAGSPFSPEDLVHDTAAEDLARALADGLTLAHGLSDAEVLFEIDAVWLEARAQAETPEEAEMLASATLPLQLAAWSRGLNA